VFAFLADALADSDADAFVHVGDRFDDTLRYLTGFSGPDRAYAFVYADGEATLCAPALFDAQARREFDGRVETATQGDPAGVRAASVLDDAGVDGPVLAPQGIPHDAALYVERAGYPVRSSDAVAAARATKTDSEVDRIRTVQAAAQRGVRRAAQVLRECERDGDRLLFADDPLTTERLRRAVDATMAASGVDPAANTVVGAGPSCADLHYRGDDPIRADRSVLLDVSPRGPDGYYGDCSRTFVVGDPGWVRRAHVAVQQAREAAFSVLEAGAGEPARTVQAETAAEIRAYGFPVDDTDRGFTHSVGHGVGVSLHEAPSFTGDATLADGHVVTIEPGVYDPDEGGVRVEDLVVVHEDGYENLTADLSPSLDPATYDAP
jgi:Xaa-Pro aminopeptidase